METHGEWWSPGKPREEGAKPEGVRVGQWVRTEHPVMSCKTWAGEAPDAMCSQKWEERDLCGYPEDLMFVGEFTVWA